jgi:hypothetical protein
MAAAWVDKLNTPLEDVVKSEAEAYAAAVEKGPTYSAGAEVDLDIRVLLVHGDEVIADSEKSGGLAKACGVYKQWLETLK